MRGDMGALCLWGCNLETGVYLLFLIQVVPQLLSPQLGPSLSFNSRTILSLTIHKTITD